MNKRIKELRDYLGLSQKDFGKEIGVTESEIARYEDGSRKPTNEVIELIRREFVVNEEWLITGQGAMFNDAFLVARCVAYISTTLVNKNLEMQKDGFDFNEISIAYKKMSPYGKECFLNFFEGLLREVKKVTP